MADKPEPPDELSYEDFDEPTWHEDAELEPIDLDALDDAIPGETETPPDKTEQAVAGLLDTLDEAITPPTAETAPPASEPVTSAPDQPETPPVATDSTPPEAAIPPAKAPHTRRKGASTRTAKSAGPKAKAKTKAAPAAKAKAEPAPAAPSPEAPDAAPPDVVPAVEPATVGAAEGAEAPPEPVIAPDVYCALLPLPQEVSAQVIELRKTGEISGMPPPGIVLTVLFRAADLAAVEAALEKWARAHLPFQFETTSVLARVIGAQQYVAAWTLEPEEELVEAQHALRRALAELILPQPGAVFAFEAYVPVGDHVAAQRYPHVIGHMQRDFEPVVWQSTDLQLVRQGEKPGEWDVVKTFD